MSVKILVCCHKDDVMATKEPYMPIHVGKAISDKNLHIVGDDSGDNISAMNPSFCELTGMYWAWKNMHPVDYIGLCHYRRYFNFHERSVFCADSTIVKTESFDALNLEIPDLYQIFQHYDVVLSKPIHYPYSLFIDYSVCHISDDLRTVRSIINDLYPDYLNAFDEVIENNNRLSHYNMMVVPWNVFDEYCHWLFNILFEAQRRIDITGYNSVQKRIWGYMAERLLNVYVKHHKMHVKYQPIYWVNDTQEQKNIIPRYIWKLRCDISFWLQKKRKQ